MTESFELTEEEQQENIQEFIDAHGSEGFFILYFRQLFYRYVKQELKSASDEVDDTGQQLYFDSEGDALLAQHRAELLAQCEERARELVSDLQSDPQFSEVIENGDIERMGALQSEFRDAVHERFEEWQDEGIELLEDVDADSDGDSTSST